MTQRGWQKLDGVRLELYTQQEVVNLEEDDRVVNIVVKEYWESGQNSNLKETSSSINDSDGLLGMGMLFKDVVIGEFWRGYDIVKGDWVEVNDGILSEST